MKFASFKWFERLKDQERLGLRMDGLEWVGDSTGRDQPSTVFSIRPLQTIINEKAIDDKVTVDIAASAR